MVRSDLSDFRTGARVYQKFTYPLADTKIVSQMRGRAERIVMAAAGEPDSHILMSTTWITATVCATLRHLLHLINLCDCGVDDEKFLLVLSR